MIATASGFCRLLVLLVLVAIEGWPAGVSTRPKLVLAIVIDQFRYDYLTRFRADYNGGLDRLLRRGAVFTNARYEHFPTVTAIGHSTFMTGAPPGLSGIVGNEWYDREASKNVTSVSDDAERMLGGSGQGASPRRLMVSALGDEMKMAWRGKPRVIGISLKDRAAILPAGHMADAAYWFDAAAGAFVSSTFYFADLPQWVKDYNRANPAQRYLNAEWTPLVPSPDFPAFSKKMPGAAGAPFYNALESTPFGNDLVEAFAERAIDAEKLGRRGVTDLLAVSFSSNDYVGHDAGPDSPETRDVSIRTDRLLRKLLDYIDARLGPGATLVVLTADHGVSPNPDDLARWKMPGGRLAIKPVRDAIETALRAKFGDGNWIAGSSWLSFYFNRDLIRRRGVSEAEVQRVAAEAAAATPHVFRVYTRDQLVRGIDGDSVAHAVQRGFFSSRSADLMVLDEPYWIRSPRGSTHGSPFGYDMHVPVIFMGPRIKPGRYDQNILPNDIAPTLATLLDVETPSGAVGRTLTEIFLAQ